VVVLLLVWIAPHRIQEVRVVKCLDVSRVGHWKKGWSGFTWKPEEKFPTAAVSGTYSEFLLLTYSL